MDVYDNFHVAPLDAPPEWEGDDSIPLTERVLSTIHPPTMAGVSAPTMVVPFRFVKAGMQGNHVYALKRMHARFRKGGRLTRLELKPPSVKRTWDLYMGPGSFYRDFRETRRLLGLPQTPVVFDEACWKKLARYADAKTLSLIAPATNTKVQKQLGWLMALYNRRYQVAYSQLRPSQLGKAENISHADCSGSIAASCDWADIFPNTDWRYTNTDSQIEMGKQVASLGTGALGDIVFYGSGNDPKHEAFYLGGMRVWSFGSYPIKLLEVDYRSDRIAMRRFVS